jgi:hypothetical protein
MSDHDHDHTIDPAGLPSQAVPSRASAADVEMALSPLWPPGFLDRMIAEMREFASAQKALGLKATTIAAMLRDTVAENIRSGDHRTPHEQEIISSTTDRLIDRAVGK